MGKDPAMPFYINDWLSSPRVLCMTLEQQGAYVRLLCHCWASGHASLPDDDGALAVLSGMGERWLKFGCPLVKDCFQPHSGIAHSLTNKKLFELWQDRERWKKKSSIGGKASAAKRKRRKVLSSQQGGSKMVGDCLPPKGNSSSSPSPSIEPPPPPPSETRTKTQNQPDFEPDWEGVVGVLLARGVREAANAITKARANGCDFELVSAVIRFYDECSPAWNEGALYQRLLSLRRGQQVEQLWPRPSEEYCRREQQQADQRLQQEQAEQRCRIEADRETAEQHYAELEAKYGDEVEALDKEGVIGLLKEVMPENPQFLIQQYRRKGLSPSVRATLIEHLASKCGSIGELGGEQS